MTAKERVAPKTKTPPSGRSAVLGEMPRIGLALGGGGARGLAHIHILEELDALGIRPTMIAGSSIGALIGAGYAAGMSGAEVRDYAVGAFGRKVDTLRRVFQVRPTRLGDAVPGNFHLGQFNIENILAAFLPEQLHSRFEDLEIPLLVTATDYYGHRGCVLEKGDLLSALAASAAVPALFAPVRREGTLYIDGGICSPVPFDLFGDRVDIVIAVDVVGIPRRGPKSPSSIDLLFGATQLMMQSITASKLARKQPDIMLRPAIDRFRVLDFARIDQVLDESRNVRLDLREALLRLRPELVADRIVERFSAQS
ncbi:patatin-like phospholipase family protein [Notoacmeibacter sp. MSK16QG-6]|uniref:patatin-like phospholipase family protein n=1 Tax=Notoacmeibacter sp. MSK16QG-6 TaxID=2957982 RepID=UPI0020A1C39B|nr:patatin-like phospholipase family protein [Notoacmeibacter sp. MSK16QG-6]MCP1198502.1 patatin-like phospholipase family protein [Notoacmeibacter sp. MSK16QG-6]